LRCAQAQYKCVADDVGQLEIHLLQGLLHVLDFAAAALNQVAPMTHQGPQSEDLFWRAEGGTQ